MKNRLSFFSSIVVSFVLGGLCVSLYYQTRGWKPEDTKFDFNSILVHHLMDSVVQDINIGGKKIRPDHPDFKKTSAFKSYLLRDEKGLYRWKGGFSMHLTKRVIMMLVVSVILVSIMILAARRIAKNPYRVNGRFAGIIETMVQFIRTDVVQQNMHGHGKGFEPYILSLFFFILFGNVFGLIPPLGEIANTAYHSLAGIPHHAHKAGDKTNWIVGIWSGTTFTGDVAVTAALAGITTVLTWITGFRYQGIKFLWSFFPKGMPPAIHYTLGIFVLFPLLFVLEIIISPLARGFALTIRLLANMTAGHVMILALVGFIFQFGLTAAVPAVIGAGAVYVLELFVACLQAFIFAILTAIFIGGTMHAH